ncbi:response regulator transcription factor [Mucilaginibacter sp. BJC16-A38]|uniref:response regulator transcription factor n=1 Tax=Mucilaginibacter phenanthrenivorans TaxID=1234842 RepID=UPI0021588609|nr:response regulator transcription factor [Mucilaginibacter phenanthrenivorans]MCR8556788.1 response regulator transcription factor [Mucilaginibacter phenanthrenivorans]
MDKITVLLAEDELALGHIVRESLEEREFNVILCADGAQAYTQYLKHKPDILALDIMMPKLDGFELLKKIREKDKITPVIFLTAKSQVKDVVAGFEIGANDYLKKPFSVEELIVRIKVLLSTNRLLISTKTLNNIVKVGDLDFDPARNKLEFNKTTIHLTARESELLNLLYQHKHEIVSRKILLEKLWGNDNFFNARSLDVFITKLRKHMAIDPQIQLINIRGVGYKLVW